MSNNNIEIGKIYTRGFLDGCASSKGNLMVYKKKDIHSLSGNTNIKYEILDIISNCQVYDYMHRSKEGYDFKSYNNIVIAKEIIDTSAKENKVDIGNELNNIWFGND